MNNIHPTSDIIQRVFPLVPTTRIVKRVNEEGKIEAHYTGINPVGTGCVITHESHNFLLTAAHVAADCGYNPSGWLASPSRVVPFYDDVGKPVPLVLNDGIPLGGRLVFSGERTTPEENREEWKPDIAIWESTALERGFFPSIELSTDGLIYGSPAYALGFPAPMLREHYSEMGNTFVPWPAGNLTFHISNDPASQLSYLVGHLGPGFSGSPIFCFNEEKKQWALVGIVSHIPKPVSGIPTGLVGYVPINFIMDKINAFLKSQSRNQD